MKNIVYLIISIFFAVSAWAYPICGPRPESLRCNMTTLPATQSGSWALTYDGAYTVDAGFGGFDPYFGVGDFNPGVVHTQAIVQFDTSSLGASAVIDSVTLGRNIDIGPVLTTTLSYYLGTWAATPPAADAPTFSGGTLAGSEPIVSGATPGLGTVGLSGSAINKTGTTSLRIDADNFILLNTISLTIIYHVGGTRGGHIQLLFGR